MIREFFCNGVPGAAAGDEEEDAPPELLTFPLKSSVLPVFELEWRSMVLGEAAADHRRPMLAAMMERGCRLRELKEEIRSHLLREAELLENSLCRKLCAIPFVQRRFLPSPLFFSIGELSCCALPLAAWVEKGRLTVVEGRSSISAEEDDLISLLHRFYGMELLGYPPERVESAVIDFAAGTLRMIRAAAGSSSTALRTIRQDTGSMIKVHAAGCAGKAEAFPASPSEKCLRCRFRSFCVK